MAAKDVHRYSLVLLIVLAISLCHTQDDPGAPLRPYTEAPVSFKLKNNLTRGVKLGSAINLTVELPDSHPGVNITKCEWTSPSGEVFPQGNDYKGSDSGSTPNSLITIVFGSTSCTLTISNLTATDMGVWKSRVHHSGSKIFQECLIAVTKDGKNKHMRLPNSLVPIKYRVFLTPFIIEKNYTIQGHVKISMKALNGSVKVIVLHSQNIEIFENLIKVTDSNEEHYNISGFGYESSTRFFMIHLAKELPAGESFTVTIDFLAQLSDGLNGFYRSTYLDEETNKTEILATTKFGTIAARKAFPCFDEPNFKASFQMNLGRLKNMTSISNMPKEKEGIAMPDNNEYVWDVYPETPKMSTYLVAAVVSYFVYRESEVQKNNVTFRIWSRKSVKDQTALAAEMGPKVLAFYEDLFKTKFPLPKQDMIAVPDFLTGAMENWGLITYREIFLLDKPGVTSFSDREFTKQVIAHELSHQWFGNLVTLKWWTDLWLNEGFARYMQFMALDRVLNSTTGIKERFVPAVEMEAMHMDSYQSSQPLSTFTEDPDKILLKFNAISYGKGASIIRMMEDFLGEDSFYRGIAAYLKRFKYRNADKDDLWRTLTNVAHKTGALDKSNTIKAIMDTWTVQMGFPVITVQVLEDTNPVQVNVSQQRFLYFNDDTIKDNRTYRWWVPLTYTIAGGKANKSGSTLWLSDQEDSKVFTLEDVTDPIRALIFNWKHVGYYRVNYSPNNWAKLAGVLAKKHGSIHRLNRAQIVKDALSLARAGLLDYKTALNIAKYLTHETDYVPLSAADQELSYIGTMLGKSPAAKAFHKFQLQIMAPKANSLGFMPVEDEPFLNQKLRRMVLESLCSGGYKPCVILAKKLYEEAKKTSIQKSPIPPEYRQMVFCVALSTSGQEEWDFIWKLYMDSEHFPAIREDFHGAFGCSNDPVVIQKVLNLTLNSTHGIRKQDGYTVISSVGQNPAGRDIAWKWLVENWKTIAKYFDVRSSIKVGLAIRAVAESFNTEAELESLLKFYKDNKNNFGATVNGVQISIQAVKANVKWIKDHMEEVSGWLKDNMAPKKGKKKKGVTKKPP